MAFQSYAVARGFQSISVPSAQIVNNILKQGKSVLEGNKVAFDIQNTWSKEALAWKTRWDAENITALRRNEKFRQENQAAIKAAMLRNQNIALKAIEAGQRSGGKGAPKQLDGLLALGSVAKTIGQWKDQQNKEEYQQGINLINNVRATSGQIAELRALEGELWDEHKNYVAAAQILIDQGASEKDLLDITSASGWRHYGMIQSGLGNSVPLFHQEILNNSDTPYTSKYGSLTLNQAKESGNLAAVNAILSQMQGQYGASTFRALGIETPNPTLASEFFEELDKISDAEYDKAAKIAETQAGEINIDNNRIETINALRKGGLRTWFSDVINTYEDPNNKYWRRQAIHNNFPYVIEYLSLPQTPMSEAQDMLTLTREDGTPLLGDINKQKIQVVIAEKKKAQDDVRSQIYNQRKYSIDEAKVRISERIKAEALNPQAIQEIYDEFAHVPELRKWLASMVTDEVMPAINKQNKAELELAASQGLLATEMVLQAKLNRSDKLKLLADERIDNPYPTQSKAFESDIEADVKRLMGINSWEQVGNNEPSLRAAVADIHTKTMRRFTDIMRTGTVSDSQAYNDALAYAKSLVTGLQVKPFNISDPNSGFIEGYTVDPNGKPLSTESVIERRKRFKETGGDFINTDALDTKQDYEYLRQKMLSGSILSDTIINDKFPWVRDVASLYGGRLTVRDVLEANAKVVGVNLDFSKVTKPEPSNLSPESLRQYQNISENLNDQLTSNAEVLLNSGEKIGYKPADHFYKIGSEGDSTGPHAHVEYEPAQRITAREVSKYIKATLPDGTVVSSLEDTQSSPYGMRFHPIHQKDLMHYGVDLALPYDTRLSVTGGAVYLGSTPSGQGDIARVLLPDGRIMRILHGFGVPK